MVFSIVRNTIGSHLRIPNTPGPRDVQITGYKAEYFHLMHSNNSEKVHRSRKKMTCELDPSVVSFLPGLALMKTTFEINAHTFIFQVGRPTFESARKLAPSHPCRQM